MLKAKNVEIRAITKEDLPLIVEWRNNPYMNDLFYEWEPISLEMQTSWYELQKTNHNERNWMIYAQEPSLTLTIPGLMKAVGTVSLVNIDYRSKKCEWGRFFIGHQGFRRKGIGAIVEALIIQYAFDHLNMNKLYCEVLANNIPVVRMHEKFGFVREGLFKHHIYKNGGYSDVVRMALFRGQYLHDENYEGMKVLYESPC